jgi:hypothetical protein
MASKTKTYKGHTLRKVSGGWKDPYGHVFRTLTDAKKFLDRHVAEGARKNPKGSKKVKSKAKTTGHGKKAYKYKSTLSRSTKGPGAVLSNPHARSRSVPATTTYRGKRYSLHRTYTTRAAALRVAKLLRGKGYNAIAKEYGTQNAVFKRGSTHVGTTAAAAPRKKSAPKSRSALLKAAGLKSAYWEHGQGKLKQGVAKLRRIGTKAARDLANDIEWEAAHQHEYRYNPKTKRGYGRKSRGVPRRAAVTSNPARDTKGRFKKRR